MTWVVASWGDQGFGVAPTGAQSDTTSRPLDHGALQQLFPQPSVTEALPSDRQPVVTCYWDPAEVRWCFAARGLGGVAYGSAGTLHYAAAPSGMALVQAWGSYFGAGGSTGFPSQIELISSTFEPVLPATDPKVEQLLVLAACRPTLGELAAATPEFVDAVWWVAAMLPEMLLRTYRWTTLHVGEYREKLSVLAAAWPPGYAEAWPKGRARLGPVTTPADALIGTELLRSLAWLARCADVHSFPAQQRSDSSFEELQRFLLANRPLSEAELEQLWQDGRWADEPRFEVGLREMPESTLRRWAVAGGRGIQRLPLLGDPRLRASVLRALLADRRTHGRMLDMLAAEASHRSGPLTDALREAGQAGTIRVGDPAREVVLRIRGETSSQRMMQWLDDLGLDWIAFDELLPLDANHLLEEVRARNFTYLRNQTSSARRDQLLPVLVEGLTDRPYELGSAGAELVGAGFDPGRVGRQLSKGCPRRPQGWFCKLVDGLASRAKVSGLTSADRYYLALVVLEALAERGIRPDRRLSRRIVELTFGEVVAPIPRAVKVSRWSSWWSSLVRDRVLILRWTLVLFLLVLVGVSLISFTLWLVGGVR